MRKHAWAWVLGGGLGFGVLVEVAPVEAGERPDARVEMFGAARPSRAPARPKPALPFAPGERLVYDVAWTLVNAGTITMSLTAERDERGARAWRLLAEGQVAGALASLYPLHYKAESSVDPATLLPRRGVVQQQEGERRRTRITLFDPTARRAHYEQVGGRQVDLDTPAQVWDSLSVLYALRAACGVAPGARVSRSVCDSGRMYQVEAGTGASASVETPAGCFEASKVSLVIRNAEGRPETGAVTLWLSNDRRRLPVKVELELALGRFSVTLREATGG